MLTHKILKNEKSAHSNTRDQGRRNKKARKIKSGKEEKGRGVPTSAYRIRGCPETNKSLNVVSAPMFVSSGHRVVFLQRVMFIPSAT